MSNSTDRVRIFSGQINAYWRPAARGYTTQRDDAGTWSRSKAEALIAPAAPEKMLSLETVIRKKREKSAIEILESINIPDCYGSTAHCACNGEKLCRAIEMLKKDQS